MSHDSDLSMVPPARTRAWLWLLIGALALAVSIGFFVRIAQRDTEAEHAGRRTSGNITALIKPHAWNVFDSGRLVVGYNDDGEVRTAEIYIDNELSDYRVGQPIQVIVHGDLVRTDREPNDPAPQGLAFLVLGAAGLGALFRGWVLARPGTWKTTTSPTSVVLPLSSWPLSIRKTFIEVDGPTLRVYIPRYFGVKPFEAPVSSVAVALAEDAATQMGAEDIYLKEEIRFLDLPTKWTTTDGNVHLVFTPPVRVPPMKAIYFLQNPLPIGWRKSRSAEGEHADVLALRAPVPHLMVEELVRAGAQRAGDPSLWLAQHREQETDPALIAELVAQDAVDEKRGRWFSALWIAPAVLLLVARWTENLWFLAAAVALLAAGFAVPALLTRADAAKKRNKQL